MKSNYKSIAKANALFGGVQIYNIIIGIVRSKFVAILLGAEGMGIMGLFNSTIDLVKCATNLGLQTSAVRDVTIANTDGDRSKVSLVYSVISKIVWFTGLLGTLLMLLLAQQLSQLTFSSEAYTVHFRVLSVVLLVAQLTVVNQVMMQGLRKLKSLAKNSIVGNTLGLLLIIPLYYFFGYRAIVPAIIITYLVSFLVSSYYLNKLHVSKVEISLSEAIKSGRQMMILGIMLSLTGLMDVIQTYLVKIFISQTGGVSDVGLYNAGFAITLGYVGLVFSSIGTDYYPRLTSASKDTNLCNDVINDQMEIMLLVLLPLVVFFVAFSKIIILILYTSEFLVITVMISWMAVGMIQRAISWCPGFLYIAKGDSKLYLIIYIITFIITTAMYLGFYYLWGLTGIGVAFFLLYFISNFSTFWITRHFYGYKVRSNTLHIMILTTLLSLLMLILSYISNYYIWFAMAFICIYSISYSYKGLDERLDLSMILNNKIRKWKNRE